MSRSRSEVFNRIMNLVIASVALALAAPVIIVFAVLIKLISPGPIFYSQASIGINRRRMGEGAAVYDRRARDLGGRPFLIYKFRSMHTNAERPNGAVWARKGDSR